MREPSTKASVASMDDEQWLALWSSPADFALSELNVAAPQPYYPLPDSEPLEYGTRLVNLIVKYARDRGLSPEDLDSHRKVLYLRGFLPLAKVEEDEVMSQAVASLDAYHAIMRALPSSTAKKFRPRFWVNRGPRVRKSTPRLIFVKETKPTADLPGVVDFVTDEPIDYKNSAELELVALAFILRRCSFEDGKNMLYTRANITGMPPIKRGANVANMATVTVSLTFSAKALQNDAERLLKLRNDIVDLASHILNSTHPLYVALLGEVLKDSYIIPQKPLKTPNIAKNGEEAEGPAEVADSVTPTSRFEQKDFTGDYGAASKGANRYILPENIDFVKYAEAFERVFEPGLIIRTT